MSKGSKSRTSDYKKYFKNWDNIKKSSSSNSYKSKEEKRGKTTYKY